MSLGRNVIALVVLLSACTAFADSTTTVQAYGRPLNPLGATSAIGGYAEMNSHYASENGVIEGFTFEFRRFNIFLYSSIGSRLKFFSELEFEHGTEEIALETAQLDLELDPLLVLRGGILVVPLGRFNQDHDSPKWQFVERPLVSTHVIPSTFSEVGAGALGKYHTGKNSFGYEVYAVNGLRDGVTLGSRGRTFIPDGRSGKMFEKDNNGSPAITGKLTYRHSAIGELGISAYHGVYNTYLLEGVEVQPRRALTMHAMDAAVTIGKLKMLGEAAMATIDVPSDLGDMFASEQYGLFAQASYPLLAFDLLGVRDMQIDVALRFDLIDLNSGLFTFSGENIYDDVRSVTGAFTLSPTPEAIVKFNYSYSWLRDILGNETNAAAIRCGIASYF